MMQVRIIVFHGILTYLENLSPIMKKHQATSNSETFGKITYTLQEYHSNEGQGKTEALLQTSGNQGQLTMKCNVRY